MINDNWKYFFSDRALTQGERYYYGGRVGPIRKTEYGYSAVVYGSQPYQTEIHMDADEADDMTCTCPYAADGNYCKHMAAVLTAITKGEAEERGRAEGETLDELLEAMSEDQLRKEMRYAADEYPRIKERLFSRYTRLGADEYEAEMIYRALEGLARQYSDRYGFIDWKHSSAYVDAFDSVLDDRVDPLIEDGEYRAAFLALDKAAHVLEQVEMDSYENGYGAIADDITEYWEETIRQASDAEQERMFRWFEEKKSQYDGMYIGDYVEYLMETAFQNPEYLQRILDRVRQDINSPDLSDAALKKLMMKYQRILGRCSDTTGEFEHWLQDHQQNPAVMEYCLSEAKWAGDKETVVRLTEALCSSARNDQDRKKRKTELAGLYRETGQAEQEREMLESLLFQENAEDLSLVSRLRELSDPDRWPQLREMYLSRHPDSAPDVYNDEKLYEKLADVLMDQPIAKVTPYAGVLHDNCPDRLLDIYLGHLRKLEEMRPCASLYAEMRSYLYKAAELEGGCMAVQNTLLRWEAMYPNRRSMQKMIDEVRYGLRNRRMG